MNSTRIRLQQNGSTYVSAPVNNLAANLILQHENFGFRSFVFCGCSKGAGATTISRDVALALAKMGWKTLMINADLSEETDALAGRVVGLFDYFASSDESIRDQIFYESDEPCLHYLPCGKVNKGHGLEAVCSQKVKALMEDVKDEYDFIVVDTPCVTDVPDGRVVASRADCAILVAASYETMFSQIEKARADLKKAKANVLGVVVNKQGEN